MWWIVAILAAAVVLGAVVYVAVRPSARLARDERRRRFRLDDTGRRLPMAGERARAPEQTGGIEELPLPTPGTGTGRRGPTLLETLRYAETLQQDAPSPPSAPGPVIGRLVDTPDGEMVLTTPPFTLRESMLGVRTGRFVNRLSARLPTWLACCPKVRLDALIAPTTPEGRTPADWAAWRRRVRWRSIDVVIVDRRGWKPLLAIVFHRPDRTPVARSLAGGQDRIIDEVLGAAGLPLLRVTGDFKTDWPLIKPYVEQAILPSSGVDPESAGLPPSPLAPETAVNLLRLDEDKGWILG